MFCHIGVLRHFNQDPGTRKIKTLGSDNVQYYVNWLCIAGVKLLSSKLSDTFFLSDFQVAMSVFIFLWRINIDGYSRPPCLK